VFVAVVAQRTPPHPAKKTLAARTVTLLALAETLDPCRGPAGTHSARVAEYSSDLAEALGLDPHAVGRIHLAGLLHDLGKTVLPESILRKPGPLTEEEWLEVARHPEVGAQMMDHPGLADVRQLTLAHHERPDGRGYPFGLRGGEIPFGARIIAVADAYEAMTADRPYRAAMPHWRATHELAHGAGTQFDRRVVSAFLCGAQGERRFSRADG
jgi:HD-GYP domain-containing protein (c-di-GMP phosphodiesterase class II)